MNKKIITTAILTTTLVLAMMMTTYAGSLSVFLNAGDKEVYSQKIPANYLEFYINSGSTSTASLYYEIRCYYDAVTDPWKEGQIVTTGIVAPGKTVGTTYFGGSYLPYKLARNYAGIQLKPYNASTGAIGGAVLYNKDANVRSIGEGLRLKQYVDEQVKLMDLQNK